MRVYKRSLDLTKAYQKSLGDCLFYLEDLSKDCLSPLEKIILKEFIRVSKYIKNKENTND